jgi:hypothetical protein
VSDPFDSISIPDFDAPPAPASKPASKKAKSKPVQKPVQEILEDADPLPLLKDAKPVLAPNPHQPRDLVDDAGRVYALPKVDLSEVEMMASVGMTTKQIADALKLPPTTFGKLVKNDPTVQEAIDRGTSRGIKMVTDSLFQNALKGNVAAQIFFLKNKGGWADRQELDQRLQVDTKMNFEDAVEALKAAGIDPSKI